MPASRVASPALLICSWKPETGPPVMTVAYATPRNVYDLGLSAQSFVVRPRSLDPRAGDFFDYATGTFSMTGHGLAADDLVRIVLKASGGTIPGGASLTTIYYPLPLDYWRFRLSLSEGGAAVTFSSAGTSSSDGVSAWGIQIDPTRKLESLILAASAEIDQDLTAHATPLEVDPITGLYPNKVVGIVSRMAARRAIRGNLFENAAIKVSADRLFEEEKRDDEQREAWRMGQPLYPAPTDQTTAADNGARAANRYTSSNPIVSVPWQTWSL